MCKQTILAKPEKNQFPFSKKLCTFLRYLNVNSHESSQNPSSFSGISQTDRYIIHPHHMENMCDAMYN